MSMRKELKAIKDSMDVWEWWANNTMLTRFSYPKLDNLELYNHRNMCPCCEYYLEPEDSPSGRVTNDKNECPLNFGACHRNCADGWYETFLSLEEPEIKSEYAWRIYYLLEIGYKEKKKKYAKLQGNK